MQKLNNDEQFAADFMAECSKMCETIVRVNNYELGDWTVEDLAAECMVKVIGNLEKYDNTYSFNTWYSHICSNTFCKHYNRYKKVEFHEISIFKDEDDEEVSIIDTLSGPVNIEESFVKGENTAWKEFMGAINGLNSNYRAAIDMCYIKGMSVKQAAAILGVNESTVNNWLARGRKKLQDFCEGREILDDLYYEMAA